MEPKLAKSTSQRVLSLSDIGVLILAVCAMLISVYQEGVLNLDKVWSQSSGDPTGASYRAGAPSLTEKLPPPVVADVDGDGYNELIVVTREPKLKLLAGNGVPGLETRAYSVLKEVSLLPLSVSLSAGRQVLALGAGYVGDSNSTRRMVIVVVTEAWHVLCFDHKLNKLWERALPVASTVHNMFLGEVAVLVSPLALKPLDKGSVIIGGRLHQADDSLGGALDGIWQREEDSDVEESLLDDGSHGKPKEEHFSYFAFESYTGHERWHHKADDFYSETQGNNLLHPQHSTHNGESDWRKFRQSFMDSLPHQWQARDDTRFDVARFERKRPGKEMKQTGRTATTDPNVLVTHLKAGIEVLHVFSGRPVSHLALTAGAAHADVDGDGIIDHVMAYGREAGTKPDPDSLSCVGVVTSAIPATHTLFRVNICPLSISSALHPTIEVLAGPPLVLRQSVRTNVVTGAVANSDSFRLFFLVSTGHVSCYSAKGQYLWQTPTAIRWDREEQSEGAASLTGFKLAKGDSEADFLLASAGSSLVLLRASNGEIMSTMSLPAPSMGVTVGDFSGDGFNDVIVLTTKGVVGFALRRTYGAQVMTVLGVVMLLALVGVFAYKLKEGLKLSRPARSNTNTTGAVRLGPRARALGKQS